MMAEKLEATGEYGAGTEATDLGAVTAKGSAQVYKKNRRGVQNEVSKIRGKGIC